MNVYSHWLSPLSFVLIHQVTTTIFTSVPSFYRRYPHFRSYHKNQPLAPRASTAISDAHMERGGIEHMDMPDRRKKIGVKIHNCLVFGQESAVERRIVVFLVPAQNLAWNAFILVPQRAKGREDGFVVGTPWAGGQFGSAGTGRQPCRL